MGSFDSIKVPPLPSPSFFFPPDFPSHPWSIPHSPSPSFLGGCWAVPWVFLQNIALISARIIAPLGLGRRARFSVWLPWYCRLLESSPCEQGQGPITLQIVQNYFLVRDNATVFRLAQSIEHDTLNLRLRLWVWAKRPFVLSLMRHSL